MNELVSDYVSALTEERKQAIEKLRQVINDNLPDGFVECMNYGMIGYVIPHSLYPSGYHCDPKLPLPFMNIASQKNFVAVYHMGMYADQNLMDWFLDAYKQTSTKKLDMGKSCIRFKKMEDIPFALIGKLASKLTVQQWITLYESAFKKK